MCDGGGAAIGGAINDCDDFFLAFGASEAEGCKVCLLKWVGVEICFEAQPVKGCDTESAFAIEDDCGDWIHGLRLLAVVMSVAGSRFET